MTGRLIAVVGPSGVGKDSVMVGIVRACPEFHIVRRVITRDPEAGGEDHDPVSVTEFQARVARGAFALHWRAHGLRYGIPAAVRDTLGAGTDCLANLSRSALPEAAKLFPGFLVLNVTARPETIARRLVARGRETDGQISSRLAQADRPLPAGLTVLHLSNDGPLADTVRRATELLRSASAGPATAVPE